MLQSALRRYKADALFISTNRYLMYSDALLQSMLLYDTKDSVWFVRA